VDFNTIPTINIERIEISNGGASATYGADTVSGVVNIITKKFFAGLELSLSHGAAEEGDNRSPAGYLMFGDQARDRVRGAHHFACGDRASFASHEALQG
jgi:outer membrane receptor protein involved in Fe transport